MKARQASLIIPLVIIVSAMSLVACSSGGDDYSENEYFRCTFEADSPRKHIQRTDDIPYTLKCSSRQGAVIFKNISISLVYRERSSKKVHTLYHADKYKYNKYKHNSGSRVTTYKSKQLGSDTIIAGPVRVTAEAPLVHKGLFKYRSNYKIYYKGRHLVLRGDIAYPDDPLARPENKTKLWDDMKSNWRKYRLTITQEVD